MRRHPAVPIESSHQGRRTQNIANVVIDLRHRLADVGKPFALAASRMFLARAIAAIGLATDVAESVPPRSGAP